jgi:hypothetical protein
MFNSPACLAVPRETSHQVQTGLPDDTRNTLRHSVRLVTCSLCKKKSNTQHTEFLSPCMFFFRQSNVTQTPLDRVASRFPGFACRFGNAKFSCRSRNWNRQTTGSLHRSRFSAFANCEAARRARAIARPPLQKGVRNTRNFRSGPSPEGPVPRAACSNLLAICPKSGVPAQLETLKNDAPRFLSRKTAHKQ